MTAPCPCDCHGRTGHPCSVLGGCGTIGCTEGQVAERRRCTGDPCADMRPGLCRWHRDRLAAELAGLPDLVAALEQPWALLPHGGAVGGRTGSDPSPGIRVEVLDFLGPEAGRGDPAGVNHPDAGDERSGPVQVGSASLADMLGSWARMVAEDRGDIGPDRWTVATARAYLVRQHDWITRQPWSDDYAAEVHAAWCTAKTLTGRWESAELLRQRYCPWCRAGALYQEPGSAVIECQQRAGGCGRRMTDGEYTRMVGMRAAYEKTNGAA